MTILFLSSAHRADDRRVAQLEASSLAAAGLRVVHVCPEGGGKAPAAVPTVTLRRRPGALGRLALLPRLFRVALRQRPSAIHANEPDTWAVAVALKGRLGCRVVFDAHEDYLDAQRLSRLPRPLRPPAGFLLRLAFRLLASATDAVIAATPAIGKRFPGTRVERLVVRNLVPRDEIDALPPAHPDSPGPLRLVAVGAMARSRGWPVMLDALALMRARARLELIGPFTDGSAEACRDRALSLGLGGQVVITGWLPRQAALARAARGHASLVLFAPGRANHEAALPHKLFEAMALGLPLVVAAACQSAAEIVQAAGCGLVVDSADPEAVAQAFDRLAADPQLRRRLGEAGRRALTTWLAWEDDAQHLIALHQRLAATAAGMRRVPATA